MNMIRRVELKDQEYLRDESKMIGDAETISFPKNEIEIIEIINWCKKQGQSITIQGGRTGLVGGSVPFGGHLLNMSYMNNVKDTSICKENGKIMVTVEAGMTLCELHKCIRKLFPKKAVTWIPNPTETMATIGGIASSNGKGINVYYYGETKRYIESVKMVLATGEIKVLVNGKDSEFELAIGGEGIYGIITELTLILEKKEASVWGVVFFFDSDEDASEYVDILKNQNRVSKEAKISVLEYFDSNSIQLIEQIKPNVSKLQEIPDINPKYTSMIYMEVEGEEQEIEKIAEDVMVVAQECNADLDASWALMGEIEIEKLRAFRHAAVEAVNLHLKTSVHSGMNKPRLSSDLILNREKFVSVLNFYKNDCECLSIKYCIFGHAGNNHLQVNILPANDEEYQIGMSILKKWAKEVKEEAGILSGEQGIGKSKKIMYGSLLDTDDLLNERNQKLKFDPLYLLNRGNKFD